MEKYQNKHKKVFLIKDYNEALIYAQRYGASMFRFVLENEKANISEGENNPLLSQAKSELYALTKEAKRNLVNGMYPCKLYIYSAMRYKLYLMYKKVLDIGGIPTAIHTDCIYFNTEKEVVENKIESSLFSNIGKYKWRGQYEAELWL